VTAAGQLRKYSRAKARNPAPGVVDDVHLPHVITRAVDLVDQPHALRKIIAESPEIDDIAAAAQCRSALDNGGFEACRLQPKGQRGPGNAGAGDQDGRHEAKLRLSTAEQIKGQRNQPTDS